MATAETVKMGPAHPPKEESINAFNQIHVELKTLLQHLRHETNKHEPEYFAPVSHLSDRQLTTFSADDLTEVRVATSAYGLHLFGKLLLPESDNKYIMFRVFIPGGSETAKLHCLHMEEVEKEDGDKVFRAIFEKEDKLDWFDV